MDVQEEEGACAAIFLVFLLVLDEAENKNFRFDPVCGTRKLL